ITFTGSTLTVTPATLTVVANPRTTVYGAALPTLTYVATGLANGDTAATALTGALATTATAASGVGNYPITQGALAAANYTLTFTGSTLTVTPAALTVTADPGTKFYGAAVPPLAYSATGLVNGDTVATALTGALATTATATSGVGSYPITQGTLAAANYTLTFTGNTLAVARASLTVAADFVLPSTNLIGTTQFTVGADSGGPSTVTVYNPDHSVAFTLNPFPGFTGGVRTAVGDFRGTGTEDVAVGTGPGVTAEVKVYDGKTGAILFDVTPFDSFQGGVFLAAGDVVGDGKADLVITPDQSGGPRVEVYHGGDFKEIANFFGIDDPDFRGGARAALGDINGDGHADLVMSAGFGGGPRVSVYDGAALAQGQQVHLVPDFFLFEDALRNGAYVAVGDVDGDGFADIVGGGGPGGGPRVLVVSGRTLLSGGAAAAFAAPVANFFAGDTENRGGVRVSVKNLDGDPFADVVVGDGTGAGSRVTGYLGKNLSTGSTPDDFEFDAFPGFTGGVYVG
ncbi:MAG TPA: MBG domain-containing protein, partial [Urbifossiella sp.]|nr:MBG domain-containing protein [Urbifossiella sp.]